MRKIIILEHISLDGVIQGPGGKDEDSSNGFQNGGWIEGYSDEILGEALRSRMNSQFDLLLGRKTYDIWAPYWPKHADIWPNANAAVKYVVSNTRTSDLWHPTVLISGDIVEKIKKIKNEEGPNLHVWGSSVLIQALLRNNLVDTIWLMIYPITLGHGKRLFGAGTVPTSFKIQESLTTTEGVIIVEYAKSENLM